MEVREKKNTLYQNSKLLGADRKAVNINVGNSLLFWLKRALIKLKNWKLNVTV